MADKQIDVRIMRLGKWNIPKSSSIFQYQGTDPYHAIGYFDIIEVEKIEPERGHPLLLAHRKSHRTVETAGTYHNNMEHCFVQELTLFSDVFQSESDVFQSEPDVFQSERDMNRFWEADSPVLYLSLVHIDNDIDVKEVLRRIRTEFEGVLHAVYFSFDYSGIVILVKNISIKEYLHHIFLLNYYTNKEERKKIIRDSYSMFGISQENLKKAFGNFSEKGYGDSDCGDIGAISVFVNIGIQNFSRFERFMQELKEAGDGDLKQYTMFGRHDLTICKENASLNWLIYVQHLLDKYSRAEEDEEQCFYTYETFVKIREVPELQDEDISPENTFYSYAKEQLKTLCDNFCEALNDKKAQYSGQYSVPVRAVQYSVLSILKNRFAEDFVLCMYKSFCNMLQYLTDRLKDPKGSFTQFDACYSQYFMDLNSLMNSAMHSERQFIQATAFNAIFYDVPPKIMALYVALIEKMQRLMRKENDREYTFLLVPGFSGEITVNIISYEEESGDRLLEVLINEPSLYNPQEVVRRMAHEVAHYVGDDFRNRSDRKKRFLRGVVYGILLQSLHSAFQDSAEIGRLTDELIRCLPDEKWYSETEMVYAHTFRQLCQKVLQEFMSNGRIKKCLEEFILRQLEKEQVLEDAREYISYILTESYGGENPPLGELVRADPTEPVRRMIGRLVLRDLYEELETVGWSDRQLLSEGRLKNSCVSKCNKSALSGWSIYDYSGVISSIFKESYADIQMVLLLDLSYNSYLSCFIQEEHLDIENLPHQMADISRITTVTMALQNTGIWDKKISSDDKVRRLHSMIQKKITAGKASLQESEELSRLVETCRRNAARYIQRTRIRTDESELCEEQTCEAGSTECPEAYINMNVYSYLVRCLNSSMEYYLQEDQRLEEMKKLRTIISDVVTFRDITATFEKICHEIEAYKNESVIRSLQKS